MLVLIVLINSHGPRDNFASSKAITWPPYTQPMYLTHCPRAVLLKSVKHTVLDYNRFRY